MSETNEVGVLFVCMGNICRSPTSEGVFRKLVQDAELEKQVTIDSAGTHAYHQGERPDRRAQAAAERRGYDLSKQRARRVIEADFERFDIVLAMDRLNLVTLQDRAPEGLDHKVRLFLDFAQRADTDEVPDPYYGGSKGFERVLDLVEQAAEGLLDHVRKTHL